MWLWSLWQTLDCVPLCVFPSALDAVAAIKKFASGLWASFLIPRECSRLLSPPLYAGDLRCDDANSHHDVLPPLVFTSWLWSRAWQGTVPKRTIVPVGLMLVETQNRSQARHRQRLPTYITTREVSSPELRHFCSFNNLISQRWPMGNSCCMISA